MSMWHMNSLYRFVHAIIIMHKRHNRLKAQNFHVTTVLKKKPVNVTVLAVIITMNHE